MNTLQSSGLAPYANQASPAVLDAIKGASDASGVDFSYLLKQASVESSFNPQAKAKTSSAAGLYQFIDRTWLGMIKEHGAEYGLGDLAKKISANFTVKDKQARREILALRKDPEIASQMAAEFAKDNKRSLEQTWGGDVGATELYLAHFLGAGQAASFLKARDGKPLRPAADLFPKAALANRNVFYDSKTGRPKSLEEVYQFFDKKFSDGDIRIAAAQDDPDAAFAQRVAQSVVQPKPVFQSAPPPAPGQIAGNNFYPEVTIQKINLQKKPQVNAQKFSSFHQLMVNPVDLMLLGRLAPPGSDKSDKTL